MSYLKRITWHFHIYLRNFLWCLEVFPLQTIWLVGPYYQHSLKLMQLFPLRILWFPPKFIRQFQRLLWLFFWLSVLRLWYLKIFFQPIPWLLQWFIQCNLWLLLFFCQHNFVRQLSFFHQQSPLRLEFFVWSCQSYHQKHPMSIISNKKDWSYHRVDQGSFRASIWCRSNHKGIQGGFVSSSQYHLLRTWFWLWIIFSNNRHHFCCS